MDTIGVSKANKRPLLDNNSGDESASDTEETSQSKRGKFSSSGSSSEESDIDWVAEGGNDKDKKKKKALGKHSTNKSSKGGGKKLSKATVSSGDSEEGSDPGDDSKSTTSGDSSESEGEIDSSSSDEEPAAFNDGLGDDLIKDEEDRQKLASMTEAEREQEIFKRHEQREALKARFEIEMKLRLEKKQEKRMKQSEKKSRKQRSLRTKEPKQNKTTRAIDELKAKRTADKQKKAAEAEKKQEVIRREPLKVAEVFSDTSGDSGSSSSDEDDENEVKDDLEDKSLALLKSDKNRPVATIEEISKIKMSRFRLEKWVHMPFFGDIIKGCYVRVGIGQHEGRMIYRVCEVVGVHETTKVYSLGSTKTNKGLKLRFGVQERVFRMEYISNSAFTEQEFIKWKNENEAHSIRLPTLLEVEKKAKEIEKCKTAQLKEEDIDKIIQEKQKFRKNPHNYALTKNRLLREKEIAEQTGQSEKAVSIAKQLEQLEERAEELDKQRTKGLSAISYINERNRQRNVERAEEALKEEMASVKDKEEDPFTRRKCMPRLVTFGKDVTDGENPLEPEAVTTNESNGQRIDSQSTSMLLMNSMEATPVPPTTRQVDDLFSAHDFDISIDLPNDTQGPAAVKASPKSVVTPKSDGPRRSLNLSDYKKRRGLI